MKMNQIEKVSQIERDWIRAFKGDLFEDIEPCNLIDFIKYTVEEVIKTGIEECSQDEQEIYKDFSRRIKEIDLVQLEKEIDVYLKENE
nr:MAG TPA: hypothetical protein [Caudoviricetes sp.]